MMVLSALCGLAHLRARFHFRRTGEVTGGILQLYQNFGVSQCRLGCNIRIITEGWPGNRSRSALFSVQRVPALSPRKAHRGRLRKPRLFSIASGLRSAALLPRWKCE